MVSRASGILVLAGALAMVSTGCGGVKVDRQGEVPLKLLDLSPRDGEVGVAADADVVAVFSVPVALGAGGKTSVNDNTFYVMDDQGTQLVVLPELSELDLVEGRDDVGGTALIRLHDLSPGVDYTIVVAGSLTGAEAYPTAPLGVDIEATFTVAD